VVYNAVNDKKSEPDYQQEQILVLNELYRIIKPGGSFFYNHKTAGILVLCRIQWNGC
jgi:site-specific DNA-methyltransferase (adenine-specific)